LKGDQGSLREDVDLFIAEQKAKNFADTRISQSEAIDADNGGRTETRTTPVIHDVDWLRKRHGRPGLNAIAMVESMRETKGVIEKDTRIYITSLVMPAHLLGPVIRSHWAIENSSHWVMDMIFRDDERGARTNHAPAILHHHQAHGAHLLRRPAGEDSFRLRRKVAGWDGDCLASLVTA
jgi:predicted transposase YbfD/YdcC